MQIEWSPDSICLNARSIDVASTAQTLYDRVCRTSFDAPGFCALNVGSELDSHAFRRLMVDLVRAMAVLHESTTGNTLVYLSAARFDQQTSTKPHLDGGPDENFLMLGYEPSEVDSDLEISDYAKCAFDLGLTPKEFLHKHNPMFRAGYDLLRPYSMRIPCFSPTEFQIICVNNSAAAYSAEHPAWQGTLHTATIPAPDETCRRVINSTMIASVPRGTPATLSEAELDEFVATSQVRRRGYDKQYLEDDR